MDGQKVRSGVATNSIPSSAGLLRAACLCETLHGAVPATPGHLQEERETSLPGLRVCGAQRPPPPRREALPAAWGGGGGRGRLLGWGSAEAVGEYHNALDPSSTDAAEDHCLAALSALHGPALWAARPRHVAALAAPRGAGAGDVAALLAGVRWWVHDAAVIFVCSGSTLEGWRQALAAHGGIGASPPPLAHALASSRVHARRVGAEELWGGGQSGGRAARGEARAGLCPPESALRPWAPSAQHKTLGADGERGCGFIVVLIRWRALRDLWAALGSGPRPLRCRPSWSALVYLAESPPMTHPSLQLRVSPRLRAPRRCFIRCSWRARARSTSSTLLLSCPRGCLLESGLRMLEGQIATLSFQWLSDTFPRASPEVVAVASPDWGSALGAEISSRRPCSSGECSG